MAVVEVLDGLLEANGDEEAEDDGGDVDEEVAPRGGGVVGGWTSSMEAGGFWEEMLSGEDWDFLDGFSLAGSVVSDWNFLT
jgi:hypothetical protein